MQTWSIGQRTQGVFRGPLWKTGNNNKNCFLRSPRVRWLPWLQNLQEQSPGGFQGVLCAHPAFPRMRLICSCFSQLRQRKRRKERKEKELSALLKRSMSSHTRWQARASPDTTPLISDLRTGARPTAEQQLRAWQAPRDPRSPVLSHTLLTERPVWASLGAIDYLDAKWICFRCSVA